MDGAGEHPFVDTGQHAISRSAVAAAGASLASLCLVCEGGEGGRLHVRARALIGVSLCGVLV